VAIPVLEEKGIRVLTVADLLAADPIDPIEVGEDDLALMQLTSGSTGSPKAVQITHSNIYSNAEAMFIGAQYDVEKGRHGQLAALLPRHGHGGFLTIPMYFGAELVKVTPMDFLRDTLLWAKLIDKYKGTMTAAPISPTRCSPSGCAGTRSPVTSTCRPCASRCPAPNRRTRRRRGPAGCGQAVRPESIGDPAGLRDGGDDPGRVLLRMQCGPGVDEVDADLLAALRRAVPATRGTPVGWHRWDLCQGP